MTTHDLQRSVIRVLVWTRLPTLSPTCQWNPPHSHAEKPHPQVSSTRHVHPLSSLFVMPRQYNGNPKPSILNLSNSLAPQSAYGSLRPSVNSFFALCNEKRCFLRILVKAINDTQIVSVTFFIKLAGLQLGVSNDRIQCIHIITNPNRVVLKLTKTRISMSLYKDI